MNVLDLLFLLSKILEIREIRAKSLLQDFQCTVGRFGPLNCLWMFLVGFWA